MPRWLRLLLSRHPVTIQRKLWLGFFLVSVLPLVALGLYGVAATRLVLSNAITQNLEREVAIRQGRVQALLASHRATVEYLRNLPSLSAMLVASDPAEADLWRRQVNQDFLALAEASRAHYQIRYLDEAGHERVRVDYRSGKARALAEAELQDKHRRGYVQATSHLGPGQVHVSAVELNQEWDAIEVPFVPVVRLSAPVFDRSGQRRGIVVLNVFASAWLDFTESGRQRDPYHLIIKADGSYVYHPDESRRWGGPSDLNTGRGVLEDFGPAGRVLLAAPAGVVQVNGRHVAFGRITPPDSPENYLVMAVMEEGPWLSSLVSPMTLVFALLVILTLAASRWAGMRLTRLIIQPISALRQGVARAAGGDLSRPVEVHSGDEIEVLAHEFNRMAAELRSVHRGLEAKVAERTRSLQEANAALERAGRLRSQFLANMSHELRTPLTAIIGFSEDLADGSAGPINGSQGRFLDNILSSARHLLGLINDVLDLSKIEAGKMSLRLETFAVRPVIAELEAITAGLFASKQLDFTVRVAPEVQTVRADQDKFKQVVLNLLSNAAKFTPSGGEVCLAAAVSTRDLVLTVADTGIGIRPEDQERIFSEFEQVDAALTRRYGGTGLGLPLSRKLVELHGGRIWVESAPGGGSRFIFTLPLGGVPPEPHSHDHR